MIALLLATAAALADAPLTLEALGALEPGRLCFTGHPDLVRTGLRPGELTLAPPGARSSHDYVVRDVGDVSFVAGPWTYANLDGNDIQSTLSAFLETHEDEYDFVSIFVTRSLNFGAFYAPLQNDIEGIGSPSFDDVGAYGLEELEGFLFMNSIFDYRGTIHDPLFFGQEVGHRWGAFTRRSGGGNDMLGRDAAHWSFWVESGNSTMEGNRWIDRGDGTFETDHMAPVGYSALDLYLMGFLPPEEVPDWFLIDEPQVVSDPIGWLNGGTRSDTPPYSFVREYVSEAEAASLAPIRVRGERVDVGLDDVIAREGARDPTSDEAQRDFRMAFVIMHPASEEISFEDYLEVEDTRERLADLWDEMVERRATLRSDLGVSGQYDHAPADFPSDIVFEPAPPALAGCDSTGGASLYGAAFGLLTLLRRRHGRGGAVGGVARGAVPALVLVGAIAAVGALAAPERAEARDPVHDARPLDPAAYARGETVYNTFCVACHGADGRGPIGANLADEPARLAKPDEELLKVIREGVVGATAAMPAWGAVLNDTQQRDVLGYLRARFQPPERP